MTGKILGDRYEILERVGEGGMSFVYKAKCRKLNRYVAVKILKDTFRNNEEIVHKFKREATSIANLSNSNIVNVLDVGTQDDIHYIVMEYVEGKTLKDIIVEREKMPYEVAITITIKVAKALECAHRNNIIHRDVKPQNILVTDEGVVKVTDFGIAKSMNSSTISYTNSVLGSAHYFSPEQAKGSYIDCRTDLYSLGIVLYEMVTGVVPFNGDSPVAVAVMHIQNTPLPPKELNSLIPDSLNTLILKSIEKDPVNRYQTVREIIEDLEKIRSNPNAIITIKHVEEEQFTRVMSPVSVEDLEKNKAKSKDNNDFNDDYDDIDIEDDSYFEENLPKKKKSKIWIWILAGIAAILIGAFSGYFVLKGLSGDNIKTVVIPALSGLTKAEAETKLENLGLKYIESLEESDKNPGEVLRTQPKEGEKVDRGSSVTLVISDKETKIKVPSFIKMNLNSAKEVLKSLGLNLGKENYEYDSSIPKDTIIRSLPAEGSEVPKDSKIDFVISKGPETRVEKVPNLIGKSIEDARILLSSTKFKIKEVKGEKAKEENQSGKVYKQDPGANYEVKEGTEITVYYYDTYIAPIKVKTNEVIGKSKKEAIAWAINKKLTIKFTPSGDNDWIIESVNVSEMEEGGTIIAKLKEPQKVPANGNDVDNKENENKEPPKIPGNQGTDAGKKQS